MVLLVTLADVPWSMYGLGQGFGEAEHSVGGPLGFCRANIEIVICVGVINGAA